MSAHVLKQSDMYKLGTVLYLFAKLIITITISLDYVLNVSSYVYVGCVKYDATETDHTPLTK